MGQRINARLDAELAQKVSYIQQRTKQRPSEIMRRSLECYYELVLEREGAARELLIECGFVGCAEADADLSLRYKEELRRSLGSKA